MVTLPTQTTQGCRKTCVWQSSFRLVIFSAHSSMSGSLCNNASAHTFIMARWERMKNGLWMALILCSFHRKGVEREGPTFVKKNFGRPKLLLSELREGFRCLGATIYQAGEKSYNECSRWNSWILPWNVLLLLTIFVKLRNLQPCCDRRGGAVLQGQGDSWWVRVKSMSQLAWSAQQIRGDDKISEQINIWNHWQQSSYGLFPKYQYACRLFATTWVKLAVWLQTKGIQRILKASKGLTPPSKDERRSYHVRFSVGRLAYGIVLDLGHGSKGSKENLNHPVTVNLSFILGPVEVVRS